MDHQQRVHPNGSPSPAGDLEMGHPPPLPAQQQGHPAATQQLGGRAANSWVGNDSNTLLVVATLITTLTYQLGTSIPGGYWQQDVPRSAKDSTVKYHAGDPIMRDLHRSRYWVFMAASWVGFASSMVMTLSLLVRMATDSRHVRWSFAVAYSSLVLTFVVSQPRTHLSLDILIWAGVVAFLWVTVSLRPERRVRVIQELCCGARDN
ncbi:hypothetical protein PR202_gb19277 [Eleusine coracana subsp. coracana]|uniref:PGG domain-containing protein n=1 Tax=Eleusine coracana subsp. coracana TaxID=191504 RepID=A0AAV5F9F0_ELECO|nr:hypothetical protein QOZ80_3BG0286500 [Eleusine coracana subsp. coracana]GJN30930.1 hypothetical protein PR202_gb19277 [Eleusine coracana subsp. coracana]